MEQRATSPWVRVVPCLTVAELEIDCGATRAALLEGVHGWWDQCLAAAGPEPGRRRFQPLGGAHAWVQEVETSARLFLSLKLEK